MNTYSVSDVSNMPNTQSGTFKNAVRTAIVETAKKTPKFNVTAIRDHVDKQLGKKAPRDQLSDCLSRWTRAGWLTSQRPTKRSIDNNPVKTRELAIQVKAAKEAQEELDKKKAPRRRKKSSG